MIEKLIQTSINHCQQVDECSDLQVIRNNMVNIAIYEREILADLSIYLKELMENKFHNFNMSIDVQDFENMFDEHFKSFNHKNEVGHDLLKKDIKQLLRQFSKICNNDTLKVFFGIVDTNMCRRFHVDMYELRMLCTYEGQGTMWLTDDNINYEALNSFNGNEEIVLRKADVEQLNTTDVAIIKGALYPNSKIGGLVHRSPTIENLNEKRIVLRVDSNSLIDNL